MAFTQDSLLAAIRAHKSLRLINGGINLILIELKDGLQCSVEFKMQIAAARNFGKPFITSKAYTPE